LIKEEWMTPKLSQILENGSIKFRGYFGHYKLSVTTEDGEVRVFNIHLSKNEANYFEFKI